METADELLTALFNSTGWVLACAEQDRQKQYELIRSVIESAIAAERERVVAALLEEHSARGVWAARVVRALP